MGELLQSQKTIDLDQVIRTETVFSRFPFHNLSKRETLELEIAKPVAELTGDAASTPKDAATTSKKGVRLARRLSRYETYWKVSPNLEFGEPRQLAYDIDTLVINKILDEAPRPIPKWIKIGTLRGICRELGIGPNTNIVRQALLQNSSAYITFKFTYKDKYGELREVTDHHIRYGLRFTGERTSEGTRAEAVYINFTDPFRDIINSTKTRPLDYAYLRSLKPTARRFYELVSFGFYAAFKNNRPYAQIRYSEYCKCAPQKRLVDRHKAQTQMGKLHRPHVQSGYLGKVSYTSTTDEEGKRDWIIRYVPGPAAREEYETFNGKRLKSPENATDLQMVPDTTKRPRKPSVRKIKRNTGVSEDISSEIVRHWRQQVGQPVSGAVSLADHGKASDLYRQMDEAIDKAKYAIDFVLREAAKTDFKPAVFGYVLSNNFPERARQKYRHDLDADEQREQRFKEQELLDAESTAYEAWVTEQIEALPGEDYMQLLRPHEERVIEYQRSSGTKWDKDMQNKSARSWLRNELKKTRLSRAHWQRAIKSSS